jgi:hypothetical protein
MQRLYDDDEERRREVVLLADEVGLGKTFVALGLAWSVLHQRRAGSLASGGAFLTRRVGFHGCRVAVAERGPQRAPKVESRWAADHVRPPMPPR